MPGGRPSLYDSNYCDKIVKLAADGWSLAEIAHEFGVARPSLYDWAEQHPEFSTALTRAKSAEQAWWERAARETVRKGANEFNGLVWKVTMQARFRDDYTERKELTGKDGGALQITFAKADADLL